MSLVIHGPGLNSLQKAIDDLDGLKLQVGWFEGSQYEDGTPVAEVAAKNEMGSPSENIPPRPFMRPTIEDRKEEWKKTTGLIASRILRDKLTAEDGLDIFGQLVAGNIRKTIGNLWHPPLSRLTIWLRLQQRADKTTVGNLDKPLVFEGILKGSTSYIVMDGPVITPPAGFES